MVASLSVTGGPVLLAFVSATGSLIALIGYGSQLYVSISALLEEEKYGYTNVKQLLSYFIPDFESLYFPQVWLAALSQAFLSLGPGVGMLLNHSANNVFRHPLRRHLWFLTTLTVVTTITVSLSTVLEAKIFSSHFPTSYASPKYEIEPVTREAFTSSSLGPDFQFLSINFSGYEERISSSDNCILFTSRLADLSCTKTAPGLVNGVPFIISSYLTTFATGHLTPWVSSVLKNLIFLGYLGAAVATSCVCMHVGVVAAREARSLPPAVAALILMAVLSLVAAPMATQAGASIIYLVDNFVLMPGLLWPSIAMLIALTTCHGVAKIRKDLTFMLESNVSLLWLPIWAGVIPLILIGITVWTFIIDWRELGVIGKPDWCVSFVWSLRVGLLISMPFTAIIVINSQLAYGFKDKVLSSLQSSREWGDWGPQDPIEHHHWRRWREDETQSYASLERRLASKSRPLTYTHSTLSSSSSSTLGRLRAKYRGQSKPYDL
ncbi:Sodium- and chloride-dependent transporter XTRP3 [Armadillidium nasatum]|uniref:Sodium-dependent nutrient amino acid transporter 1 n=1 Tax=Armadillidium nasatum TaxID=96803 RepID=A0A5N5SRZ6_9CRUS|nr:Sodium- and chloride-dependent transporter XTRP3 [Armadillidium nasatum]